MLKPILEQGFRDRYFDRSTIGSLDRHVSIADSFFNLGGHFLLGVRLFVQIEAEFSKKLPRSESLEFPTVEGLAAILAPSASRTSDVFGKKTPLFLLHDADDQSILYLNIST